jgi:hypothetical protein
MVGRGPYPSGLGQVWRAVINKVINIRGISGMHAVILASQKGP